MALARCCKTWSEPWAAADGPTMNRDRGPIRLGLGANRRQFALLVLINAFVGTMVGVERSVLPILAAEDFGITSARVTLTFLLAFGLAKALANFFAGDLSGRVGRKRILVTGWLVGLPVPFLLMVAPSWTWIVIANLFLGVNQGLAWSATVIMKIDLVGPRKRGLAMGINEFAGYVAVGLAALLAGYLAAVYGPRPAPYVVAAVAAILGLTLSLIWVEDTGGHVALETAQHQQGDAAGARGAASGMWSRLARGSWGSQGLVGANQAGMVNNLNDGLVWGLVPLFLAHQGLGTEGIGLVAAVYPVVWGLGQLATGAASDVWGRRPLIVIGMGLQGLALVWLALAGAMWGWVGAAVVLGIGTAAVYPTLLAQVSDLVSPGQRASAVGVYRLWRDGGYVVGALVAGLISDWLGYQAAILSVAGLTVLSGILARLLLPAPEPESPTVVE